MDRSGALHIAGRLGAVLAPLFFSSAAFSQVDAPTPTLPELITSNMNSACGPNFEILTTGPSPEAKDCLAMGISAVKYFADQFEAVVSSNLPAEETAGLSASLQECKAAIDGLFGSGDDTWNNLLSEFAGGMTGCLEPVAVFAGSHRDALGDRYNEFFQGYDLLDAAVAEITPPSSTALKNLANITEACPNNWESQECAHALAVSTTAFVSQYNARVALSTFQGVQRLEETANILDACSPVTLLEQIPVDQRDDTLAVCANQILDVFETSGIRPELHHFRLIVGPTQCLAGDKAVCAGLDNALRPR